MMSRLGGFLKVSDEGYVCAANRPGRGHEQAQFTLFHSLRY